ncbi:hypothetical protein TWF696_009001 [Orbilia brochopaga]|uniref:DUF6697 domain-containing protein n=1 Tax=Orbilia brochopaga TaxID=3140254 RepID=A0AAV9UG96_9PEZI
MSNTQSVPSLPRAVNPDLYVRYGSNLFGCKPALASELQSPAASREPSREASIPSPIEPPVPNRLGLGILTTAANVALNSTPPISPAYPSPQSPEKPADAQGDPKVSGVIGGGDAITSVNITSTTTNEGLSLEQERDSQSPTHPRVSFDVPRRTGSDPNLPESSSHDPVVSESRMEKDKAPNSNSSTGVFETHRSPPSTTTSSSSRRRNSRDRDRERNRNYDDDGARRHRRSRSRSRDRANHYYGDRPYDEGRDRERDSRRKRSRRRERRLYDHYHSDWSTKASDDNRHSSRDRRDYRHRRYSRSVSPRSTRPIAATSYSDTVAVARGPSKASQDQISSNRELVDRGVLSQHKDAAPSTIATPQSTSSTGCQTGVSPQPPVGTPTPRDTDVIMRDASRPPPVYQDRGTEGCSLISLPLSFRLDQPATARREREIIDVDTLVDRIVEKLEDSRIIKKEKKPKDDGAKKKKKKKRTTIPAENEESSVRIIPTPGEENLTPSAGIPMPDAVSEDDDDEEAFCRTRKRRETSLSQKSANSASTGPPAFPNSSRLVGIKERAPSQAKRPELEVEVRPTKKARTEAPLTPVSAHTQSPSHTLPVAGPLSIKPPNLNFSSMKKRSNASPTDQRSPKSPYSVNRPAIQASSTGPGSRIRAEVQPDDYWFQSYYKKLCSEVQKPRILTGTKKYFSRKMISHYIGGNPRTTICPVRFDRQWRSKTPIRTIVAFCKEILPIRPEPGGVIVVCTIHNFASQIPGTQPFPIFVEREIAEWEYIGTYQFDNETKLLSDKEVKDIQNDKTGALVEWWIDRLFAGSYMTQLQNEKLKLCQMGVDSLAEQLVPGVLKKRMDVETLTHQQVRRYFREGTLRLRWNFLKPVSFDYDLYRRLCKAEWPLKNGTKPSTWDALKK